MKFMLLIHQGLTHDELQALPADDKQALYAAWGAIRDAPGVTPGLQLAPPEQAATVRAAGNGGAPLVTDGPFAETKEAVGGYLILEADDRDAALELARRIPAVAQGGAVEVRPIVEW